MLKFSEILELSKEKFRKIPILKEFEWFEWFEMVRMVRSLADRTFQLWQRRAERLARKPVPERGDGVDDVLATVLRGEAGPEALLLVRSGGEDRGNLKGNLVFIEGRAAVHAHPVQQRL